MVHFLRQLQSFTQLEVIDCSWQALVDFTSKREGDLDALIGAHRKYLDRIVRKVLLLGSSRRDKEEILLDLVREAMNNILQFKAATVGRGVAAQVTTARDGTLITAGRSLRLVTGRGHAARQAAGRRSGECAGGPGHTR